MAECNLTPYSGNLPNSGQTDEQNMIDCTEFMKWLVENFTRELNENFPTICAAEQMGDMSKYVGEWKDGMSVDTGYSVSVGESIYISKIDANTTQPPDASAWIQKSWGVVTELQNDINMFDIVVPDNTNMALVSPITFTSLTIGENSVVKFI